MFSGTIRSNLDPFGRYSAEEASAALAHVRMEGTQLETLVTKGGANFSAGERQALALARVVLHSHRRIVVMDEPTANIDAKTDSLLQTMLREIFAERTLLVIAHRLMTVIQMGKIAVRTLYYTACLPACTRVPSLRSQARLHVRDS